MAMRGLLVQFRVGVAADGFHRANFDTLTAIVALRGDHVRGPDFDGFDRANAVAGSAGFTFFGNAVHISAP